MTRVNRTPVVKPVRQPVLEVSGERYLNNILDQEGPAPGLETLLAQAAAGQNPRDWQELTAQLTAVSPAFMAQEILSGPPGPPYNGRFMVARHHLEWDNLVINYKRLCVLSPRDSGKTYFFNLAVPIWRAVVHEAGTRGSGYIFSATQDMANRILGDVKAEIEANPRLQWLIPDKRDMWRTSSIGLSNGLKIYARGMGTRVRGAHPYFIIVDDGLTDETAVSETVRQKQIDYFYSAITNMVVPGGQIIVVGTPFCKTDLYGDLKKNPS